MAFSGGGWRLSWLLLSVRNAAAVDGRSVVSLSKDSGRLEASEEWSEREDQFECAGVTGRDV